MKCLLDTIMIKKINTCMIVLGRLNRGRDNRVKKKERNDRDRAGGHLPVWFGRWRRPAMLEVERQSL